MTNWDTSSKKMAVHISGSDYTRFAVFRTTEGDQDAKGLSLNKGERYHSLGMMTVENGVLKYEVPAGSVTTFFGVE